MATTEKRAAGYGTEYSDNYTLDKHSANTTSWNDSSGLFDGKVLGTNKYPIGCDPSSQHAPARNSGAPQTGSMYDARAMEVSRDPSVFPSQIYPSVYRETVVHKDDRGNYIDPFKNIATKPYGRRLMYDPSHPDKMYPSLCSSELADHSGCYSFPTTTGLKPEIPFNRDLQWQAEGEVGQWPTDLWKTWKQVACSPPYDGHDDQVEYSKYKVPAS